MGAVRTCSTANMRNMKKSFMVIWKALRFKRGDPILEELISSCCRIKCGLVFEESVDLAHFFIVREDGKSPLALRLALYTLIGLMNFVVMYCGRRTTLSLRKLRVSEAVLRGKKRFHKCSRSTPIHVREPICKCTGIRETQVFCIRQSISPSSMCWTLIVRWAFLSNLFLHSLKAWLRSLSFNPQIVHAL